ncbi:hypothetical protein CS8_078310 [Cupriavidus sp. 8B]
MRALIAEALEGSPSIDMAKARLAAAAAYSEGANANTLPRVDAGYTLTRQQYSGTALAPPPIAGSWQTENRGVISASYELDLWGKNREALASSISARRAAEAESEQVRLSVSSAVARAYNELARLYALLDIAQDEVRQRTALARITHARAASGLDTEVEQRTADANLDASNAAVTALNGAVLNTRYQLGALLGRGPDRGLAVARPTLSPGDEVRLPDNLPADLVSRRPDIVAAQDHAALRCAGAGDHGLCRLRRGVLHALGLHHHRRHLDAGAAHAVARHPDRAVLRAVDRHPPVRSVARQDPCRRGPVELRSRVHRRGRHVAGQYSLERPQHPASLATR